MYNAKQKQDYINEKMSEAKLNEYFLPNCFKKSEPFEEQLGKDVSCFTTSEIENMYKMMNFRSAGTLALTNSAYSGYTNWCLMKLRNVPDSQNHFLEFDQTRMSSLLNMFDTDIKFVSRDEVETWADSLRNPRDSFILLALYEGIKGKNFCELVNLKESDVDAINDTINVPGRGVRKYSKKLCMYAMESAESILYYTFDRDGDLSEKTFSFVPSDLVIKETTVANPDSSEFRKGRRTYTNVMRALRQAGASDKITPTDIYRSGLIGFINAHAKELGISAKEYIRKHRSEIQEYYPGAIQPATFIAKNERYLE